MVSNTQTKENKMTKNTEKKIVEKLVEDAIFSLDWANANGEEEIAMQAAKQILSGWAILASKKEEKRIMINGWLL
jgi:hypothetical protein